MQKNIVNTFTILTWVKVWTELDFNSAVQWDPKLKLGSRKYGAINTWKKWTCYLFASFLCLSVTWTLPPKLIPPAVFWIPCPFITSKVLCPQLTTSSSISSFFFTNKHSHAKKNKKSQYSMQHITTSYDTGFLSMNLNPLLSPYLNFTLLPYQKRLDLPNFPCPPRRSSISL